MYVGVSYVIPYSRAPTFTQFCEKAGNPDCVQKTNFRPRAVVTKYARG